jgi:methylglutaconyl-CoA hydratase
MEHLRLSRDQRGVAWLTLDRPDQRIAFNAELIAELSSAAAELTRDRPRAVVLAGAGPSFSAGADLTWMRSMQGWSQEENLADARAVATMFRALDEVPCAVIGRVHGHAMGGGAGLLAVCDVVVAATNTVFAFSEVRLGIAPAVISPFVVRRIGRSHARALFVTGERFDAAWAQHIGLVHRLAAADALDDAVTSLVDAVLAGGPEAVGVAKRLPELALASMDEAAEATARIIAHLRNGDEGQEGMAAFVERRPPSWTADDG